MSISLMTLLTAAPAQLLTPSEQKRGGLCWRQPHAVLLMQEKAHVLLALLLESAQAYLFGVTSSAQSGLLDAYSDGAAAGAP